MLHPEKTVKIKVMSHWTVFEMLSMSAINLHLKSFAWKRDCPISSKLQPPQS